MARSADLVPASSVRPRQVSWLWKERIPLSELTLLVGEPGVGKTTLLLDLAAQLTRGRVPGSLRGHPARVIVASAEDSPEATLVPRLVAARADLDLVDFTGDGFSIPADLPDLEDRIAGSSEPYVLLVLDPLEAFLPVRLNTWRNSTCGARCGRSPASPTAPGWPWWA